MGGTTDWGAVRRRFARQDAAKAPASGWVVFAGTSVVQYWDLARCFPGLRYCNRGVAGSLLTHCWFYPPRVSVVADLAPSHLVLYAGDNDLAAGNRPVKVSRYLTDWVRRLAEQCPRAGLVYLGVKPSLARQHLAAAQQEYDRLAEGVVADVGGRFVPTRPLFLDEVGSFLPGMLAGDGLHPSDKGYDVLTQAVAPYLPDAPPGLFAD